MQGWKAAMACVVALAAAAQAGQGIAGLPGDLEERNGPVSWSVADGSLAIDAPGQTNWFVSPTNLKTWDNAPTLLFRPDAEFSLSAKVTNRAESRWDAGALVLFVRADSWAKLCLEAPNGPSDLAVVSVVTRGESDDSYSIPVAGKFLYMKVAKIGQSFAFYVSPDGKKWQMMRAFRLGDGQGVKAGFLAQSPTGKGLTAVFSEIHYSPGRVNLFTGE
jgi:uncharacterized protein